MITEDQKDQCAKAGRTISNLDYLTKREEFREFMEQFQRRADELAQTILEDDTVTAEVREQLRQRRKGILEVVVAPEEDMLANRRIIEAVYGTDGMDDD